MMRPEHGCAAARADIWPDYTYIYMYIYNTVHEARIGVEGRRPGRRGCSLWCWRGSASGPPASSAAGCSFAAPSPNPQRERECERESERAAAGCSFAAPARPTARSSPTPTSNTNTTTPHPHPHTHIATHRYHNARARHAAPANHHAHPLAQTPPLKHRHHQVAPNRGRPAVRPPRAAEPADARRAGRRKDAEKAHGVAPRAATRQRPFPCPARRTRRRVVVAVFEGCVSVRAGGVSLVRARRCASRGGGVWIAPRARAFSLSRAASARRVPPKARMRDATRLRCRRRP